MSRIEEKTGSILSEKNEKPALKNYMKDVRQVLAKKNDFRAIKNLIEDNSMSEIDKRDKIKAQSSYWELKAQRIEQALKYKKNKEITKRTGDAQTTENKDEIDEINELYLNSVKAKLALFKG